MCVQVLIQSKNRSFLKFFLQSAGALSLRAVSKKKSKNVDFQPLKQTSEATQIEIFFRILAHLVSDYICINLKNSMRDYFLTLTNDGGEKIVFLCGVKTDQIHASVPAEIATIKPIPVFKFVPRFPPRQEIIMAAPLHVRNSCSRKQTLAK